MVCKDTTVKIDDNGLRNLNYNIVISLSILNSKGTRKNKFEMHMR